MSSEAERLEEIRGRCEAATPAPWSCWNGYEVARSNGVMAMTHIGPARPDAGGLMGDWKKMGSADLYASREDAEFVAHAREDIPFLLNLVGAFSHEMVKAVRVAVMLERKHAEEYGRSDARARILENVAVQIERLLPGDTRA